MGSRRRIGTALHLSNSSGNLILKAEDKLKIGEAIFDADGKRIGTVFDLFGPVSRPFVAVKPGTVDKERLLGKPFFLGKRKK